MNRASVEQILDLIANISGLLVLACGALIIYLTGYAHGNYNNGLSQIKDFLNEKEEDA